MTIFVGIGIVIACVIGGYMMAHGVMGVLFQPAEFVIIVGAAVGGLVIGTPTRTLKVIGASLKNAIKSTSHAQTFLDVLKVIFDLASLVRAEGLLAMEKHVENPTKSEILGRLAHHEDLMNFLVDSLRLVLLGTPIEDMMEMLEAEFEIREHEAEEPGAVVATVADALPGLGIVAAVLGIIITMNSIGGDSASVGKHVAAALVGTFLGVLLAYGFVSPLASAIKHERHHALQLLRVAKAGVVGIARGGNPLMTCESARHDIPTHDRPSFNAMEEFLKGSKGK